MPEIKETKKTILGTIYLFYCAFVISLGGFQFGYATGVLNNPAKYIRKCDELGDGFFKNCIPMDEDLQWPIAVSIYTVGGMIGGLTAGIISSKIGRRLSLMLINMIIVVACFLMGFFSNFYIFCVGRILIGVAAGAVNAVVPPYLGEIAPNSLRGAVGVVNSITSTGGILIAQVFGMFVYQQPIGWRVTIAIPPIAVAIIHNILLPLTVPKSPAWLFNEKKDYDAAQQSFEQLRQTKDVEYDMHQLRELAKKQKSLKFSAKKEAEKKKNAKELKRVESPVDGDDSERKGLVSVPIESGEESIYAKEPVFVEEHETVEMSKLEIAVRIVAALQLQFAQQLSGINAIFMYSTDIFESLNIDNGNLMTVLTGLVNLGASLVAFFTVDCFGRRPLLLLSQTGEYLSFVVLSVAFLFNHLNPQIFGIIEISCFFTYIISFAMGMGPIPFAILQEMLPSKYLGMMGSIAVFLNWTTNFIVSLGFPIIRGYISRYPFVPFVVFILFFLIVTTLIVPETKGALMKTKKAKPKKVGTKSEKKPLLAVENNDIKQEEEEENANHHETIDNINIHDDNMMNNERDQFFD